MHFSILLLLVCVPMGIILKYYGDTNQMRKIYIFSFFSCLTILSVIRSLNVGPDTEGYYILAQEIHYDSWRSLWRETVMRYLHNTGDSDMGYYMFVKCLQLISTNFDFLSVVACAFYLIPLGKLIYRYTTNMSQILFSFVLYSVLFPVNTVSPNRQLFATGFCILALLALSDGKFIKSVLLILVGSLFHQTALVFLAIPCVVRFVPRWVKKMHLLSFFFIPVSILYASQILLLMSSAVGNDRYAAYADTSNSGGGIVFSVLLEVMSIFCYFGIKKEQIESDRRLLILYAMTPFFTVLGPLIMQDGAMIRLSKYFHLYLMMLVPLAIENVFNKDSIKTAYGILIIALILMTVTQTGGLVFEPYWNDPYIHDVAY